MGKRRRKPQRQVSQEYFPEEFEPAVVAEVESLFKRHFEYCLPCEGEWRLPPTDKWLPGCNFTDEHLEPCKQDLNEAKSSLSDYDINKWQEHTSATNRAGLVMSYLRHHRKPELCTQAWCKFHEILHSFPVLPLPKDTTDLNTVHLCEAPGAFISSLNHFIISKGYACSWQWRASTLNPYYEGNSQSAMIAEDSFIKETLDHWLFGADDTGDIMNEENILHVQEQMKEIAPVALVTADGGIDCQNNPGEQESSTALLHLAEIVAAFHILSSGGSFVLKMFTLFESYSFCLLYLLNCLFNKVSVCKPATSKSGNSEVYVVCLGYKGASEAQMAKLQSALGDEPVTLFHRVDLPEDFVSQHRQCVQLFAKLQLQTIQENKRLHQNTSSEVQQRIEQTRRCCAMSYINRFSVKTIPHWQYIVDSGKEKFHKSWHGRKARVLRHVGSYNDRQKDMSLTWNEQLQKMEQFQVGEYSNCAHEGNCRLSSEMLSQWAIVMGKPYRVIQSSKFCDSSVLQRYTSLLGHSMHGHSMHDLPSMSDLMSVIDQMDFQKDTSFMWTDDGVGRESIPVMCSDESGENNLVVSNLKDTYGNKISMVTSTDRDQFDYFLLIPELLSDDHLSNTETQLHMLMQLIWVLKNADEGDHLIFPIYESITRFSAGIVFILQFLFTKIVALPSSSGHSPYFLGCLSYQCPSDDLVTYLSQVKEKTVTYLAKVKKEVVMAMVLQFVPIHYLCESRFYQFIVQVNNMMLKRTSNCFLSEQQRGLELENLRGRGESEEAIAS